MKKIGVSILIMVAMTATVHAQKNECDNTKKLTRQHISGKGIVDIKKLQESFELFEKW